MLKHFGIRSWIGILAVVVAAAGIFSMQDRVAAWWTSGHAWGTVARDDPDWRQRELIFLKQLYDRLETERKAQRGRAPASLLAEQQTILRRMEQTAAPIRGKVPPEIGVLLRDQPIAATEEPPAQPTAARAVIPGPSPAAPPTAPATAPAASMPPAVAPQTAELRAGAAAFPGIEVDAGMLSRDPELDQVMERVQKIRKRAPAKPSDSNAKTVAAKPPESPSKPAAGEPGGSAKP